MFGQQKKHTHYVDTLCLLYEVFNKVRGEGLLSIEADIDSPDSPATVFARYPAVREHPRHFEFMIDALRQMIGGGLLDTEDVRFFHETAKKTFLNDGGKDEALWDTIYAAIHASLSGYLPQMAIEFGRQAVPYASRPTFYELEARVKELRAAACQRATQQDDKVDKLFARMKAAAE
jgi:chemotaxis protein MotA